MTNQTEACPSGSEPRICAQLITYNEENNIRECLKSLEWADEIIVVDSFSSDVTPQICREFHKVRLVQNKWPGFARQRNFGLTLTRAEWVLILDADERITPALAEEIMQTIASPRYAGYRIPKLDHMGGLPVREGRFERPLRLFRREFGRYDEYLVHEKVSLQGQTGSLRNCMLHDINRDLSHFIAKRNEYSRLAAQQMFEQGKRFSLGKLLFHTIASFIQSYIIRQKFRSGVQGFIVACFDASYTMMKYAKLWELGANRPKTPIPRQGDAVPLK